MLILEKVGGGAGGEAAWIADAMLRPVGGNCASQAEYQDPKWDVEASNVECVKRMQQV